jgi:nucleoside-diphosphate-sugar epimerase
MHVLVTGATGNIASALIPQLRERGHTVRALVRPTSRIDQLEAWGAELHRGDLTDGESLRGVGDGIDAVFHLGGALWAADEAYLRTANVEGTRRLAEACADRGLRRFIFASFPQVLGPASEPMPEDAPARPIGNHARWKLEGEELLLALHQQGRLPVVIARLGTVYGPGMRIIELYRRLLRLRLMATFGWGRYLTHFVHVEDAVQGLLLALECEQAAGRAYHICDDRPVQHRTFVNLLAERLGVWHPLPAPVPAFRAIAALATLASRVTDRPPFLTQDAITMATVPSWADTSRAKAELGFAPKYPTVEQGIATCG